MTTVAQTLLNYLVARETSIVFGIPGVHTLELYRGLARSGIRHITARHEQGAGFMADGYARVSGKVGVAFVITGPGVTNILTPMAQARADSVSMLVVSSVNEQSSLGLGLGHLHELPDQQGVCALLACTSRHVTTADKLLPALNRIYTDFSIQRPGPAHIEIPLDVMGETFSDEMRLETTSAMPFPDNEQIENMVGLLGTSEKPVILVGGGARHAEESIRAISEMLSAPVVQTVNARGLMHRHPLTVPASPSLKAVRKLLKASDVILAVGTEIGTTDYDVYRDNELPVLKKLIRIDICANQLKRTTGELCLHGDSRDVLVELAKRLHGKVSGFSKGEEQAKLTRNEARAELTADYLHQVDMLEVIRNEFPGSIVVGDSTQPIYAGNLYYDHDRSGGWFNSATGYGALGYAIPASVGAALAEPESHVVCISGDGGAQFTLTELMTAVDENLSIVFVIWNSQGYLEIAKSMSAAGIEVVGCNPRPPNFADIAQACSMEFISCANDTGDLKSALQQVGRDNGPAMIEIRAFEGENDE